MMCHSSCRILRCTITAVALLACPALAGAQCQYDISVYADGAHTGAYDANGNGELVAWGGGIDNSSCPGGVWHEYAFQLTVARLSDNQVVAGSTGSTSAEVDEFVEPVWWLIDALFGVYCSAFQNWVGGGGDQRAVQVTPRHTYQQWPTDSCQINQGYSSGHRGYDLDATAYNTAARSMDAGTVTHIRSDGTPGGQENFVIVQGSDGLYTIYAHVTPSVSVNQSVSAGQTIGQVDNTGTTSGPHTHVCRSATPNCSGGIDFQVPSCG